MRTAPPTLLALALSACGMNSLRSPPPAAGPPAENECAVDVVNGRSVPMGVTLYSRSANDLGVLQPSRTVRYAEECTARSWTVTAIPRSTPAPDPKEPTKEPWSDPVPDNPRPFSQTVDVRPGTVVQVVL